MLTDEFRTLWATAMDNHRARSDRLRSLLNVKNAILPGIPMTGQGNVTEFLRHPCMLRRKEGLYLASHGTAWLCANELNAGLAEATDTHGIPDDEELIANTVIYLMIRAGDWLIVEVLNKEDYATYLFRWGEVAALYPAMRFERVFVMHIARAFDSINFRREPVYEKADTLQEKYGIQIDAIERKNPSVEVLRKRFAGRIIHTAGWQSELDRLLT